MFVIRLPNGNLRVPRTATADSARGAEGAGRVIGEAYVEIGPGDADYKRLAKQALTEEEFEQRRSRWQAEDDALYRQFLEFRAERDAARDRRPPHEG
jgi:hypothetical protein